MATTEEIQAGLEKALAAAKDQNRTPEQRERAKEVAKQLAEQVRSAENMTAIGPFSSARKDLVDKFGNVSTWKTEQPSVDSLDSLGDRLGALKIGLQEMLTFDDQRIMNAIESNYPGVKFEDDGQGNVVVDFTDIGGGKGYLNPPGFDTGDAKRAALVAAQFTPGGKAAGMLGGGLVRQGVAQGTMAGITETVRDVASQAAGGTEDVSVDNLDTGTIATTAAFGAAAPAIAAGLSKLIRRVIPGRKVNVLNDDGSLTDEALKAIDDAGADRATLNSQLAKELQKDGVLTPEQASRFNLFKSQGVQPTRANLTQTADDFRFQQEGMKSSGVLREAVDTQDSAIASRLSQLADDTGSVADDAYAAGDSVFNAVTRRAVDEDAAVSAVYKQIREGLGPEKIIKLPRTAKTLQGVSGRNELSGGMVKAIKSELTNRGLIDDQWRPIGRVDAATAEEVRQTLNTFYDGANSQGRMILREIKNAFDDDVTAAAGEDFFRLARAAKTQFQSNLAKARASKFDQNSKNLVEDILENKINRDDIFKRAVVNSGYGVDDLKMLREYLLNGTPEQVQIGTAAWNDLRRQTIEYLTEQATSTAAKAEGGGVIFNANQFAKAIDRIGGRKMAELFPDIIGDIMDIRKIGRLRIPVTMTQQGEGPTSMAVKGAVEELAPDALKKVWRAVGFGAFRDAKQAAIAADPVRATINAFDRAANLTPTQGQAVTQGVNALLE